MKFTALEIRPLGDNDEQYGQRYWGRVEESEMSVSFNLMNPVEIPIGAELEFEERAIKETGPKSKNPGTEYLFLKKVKVSGGQPLTKSPPSDAQKTLELILDNTTKILALVDKDAPKTLKEAWDKTTEKDNVLEDIGEEPMSMDQIPF